MKSENQNITLQKKFNKIYLDIFQHSKNTKNWIKHSSRKKGDLNKSIKNLEKKYKELVYIKKRLQNQGFSDKELFSTASKKISLDKYKQLIIDLKKIYTSTETPLPKELQDEENKYFKNIEFIYDYDYNNKYNYHKNPYNYDYIFYTSPKEKNYKIWFKTLKEKFKQIINKPKKFVKGLVSFILASAITFAGGITAGESEFIKTVNDNSSKSYTDNIENNTIPSTNTKYEIKKEDTTISKEDTTKSTINSQEISETTPSSTTQNSISEEKNLELDASSIQNETQPILNEDNFNISDEIYIAPKGTIYTESSDGSGDFGYFVNDNEVRAYCRALTQEDSNGNVQILEVSIDNWKKFVTENNLNYEDFNKYKKENNLRECICIQSTDKEGPNGEGKYQYGWVDESNLQIKSKAPQIKSKIPTERER